MKFDTYIIEDLKMYRENIVKLFHGTLSEFLGDRPVNVYYIDEKNRNKQRREWMKRNVYVTEFGLP